MIYELDKETVDFICKKRISFTQFAICLLIHAKDTRSILQIDNELGPIGDHLIFQGTREGRSMYVSEIDDLINRGFLLNHGLDKNEQYALDNFIVTEKFTKDFLSDEDEMCKEFWREYPAKLLIQGVEKVAKAIDYFDFCTAYIKAIGRDQKLHKEVIAKLKALNQSNGGYAEMNIKNFVGSRHWENLNESVRKSRSY